MSHFAKIDENGLVVDVIVAEEDFVGTLEGVWVRTSYTAIEGKRIDPNTGLPLGGIALRKNYASVGFTYDSSLDAFIPPNPFPSWTLNTTTCTWDPPVPRPSETEEELNAGKAYTWDEHGYVNNTNDGWILVGR